MLPLPKNRQIYYHLASLCESVLEVILVRVHSLVELTSVPLSMIVDPGGLATHVADTLGS